MKPLTHLQTDKIWGIVQRRIFFILVVFIWLGGCSIWDAQREPDYQSSRADRLCHPYGECTQGTWVAVDGTAKDATVAKAECQKVVDPPYANGWWEDSVSRGLEIGKCMEKKGFTLKP